MPQAVMLMPMASIPRRLWTDALYCLADALYAFDLESDPARLERVDTRLFRIEQKRERGSEPK